MNKTKGNISKIKNRSLQNDRPYRNDFTNYNYNGKYPPWWQGGIYVRLATRIRFVISTGATRAYSTIEIGSIFTWPQHLFFNLFFVGISLLGIILKKREPVPVEV